MIVLTSEMFGVIRKRVEDTAGRVSSALKFHLSKFFKGDFHFFIFCGTRVSDPYFPERQFISMQIRDKYGSSVTVGMSVLYISQSP